jgi:hypothetical protein
MTPMFERWGALHGHKTLGASPETVARFVADIAPMGIAAVWDAVQQVSRAHYMHGLASPCDGGPVAAAINELAGIPPPRSWPKEEQIRFKSLPYDIQLIISKRERDRDNQVRTMQHEFARLKKETENGIQTSSTDTEQAAA